LAESKPMTFRNGFLQTNDAVVCGMRMCMKPQSAYWRQPSTEEKPIKAVDPPEPPLSVLTMGIPHFTLSIAAGPAVGRVR
jgi:hypothetical protein